MKSGWTLLDFTGEIHQISGWNLVDFMKSLVIALTLHSSNWRVFAETLAFIILGGFQRWNLGELCWISQVKSTRFRVKSGGFHEILGHSPHLAFIKLKSFCWNTCFYNFGWISKMKSGWTLLDFTGEIHQISGWNLVDFMKSLVIALTLHSSNWRVFAETLAFIILGGFHRSNLGEIHQISWLKSTRFQGEIHQISRVKSPTLHSSNWRVFAKTLAFIILGGFHRWNLGEICQISWLKSTRFHGEIHWISRVKSPTLHSSNWRVFAETLAFIIWVDFTGEIWVKSARFHGWNPPDFRVKYGGFHEILGHSPHPAFIKLKSFCWNTCFYNFGWISQVISRWNPLDFTDFMESTRFHGEIHQISGWNPYEIRRISWNPYEIRRISWNVSFCVMIKYRSFDFRKTKHPGDKTPTCSTHNAMSVEALKYALCQQLLTIQTQISLQILKMSNVKQTTRCATLTRTRTNFVTSPVIWDVIFFAVCVSVCVFACSGYNFWSHWHRNIIFGMVVDLDHI